MGEIAGTSGTDLADYQKSIECVTTTANGDVVARSARDSAGPLNVTVDYGDDIVCTITNTRETGQARGGQGPEPERPTPGTFNLQIDGATPNAGARRRRRRHDRREDAQHRPHTVGETAGTAADLADYQKSIELRRPRTAPARRGSTSGADSPAR